MFKLTGTCIAEGDAARARKDWPDGRGACGKALRRRPTLGPIWVRYGHALKEAAALPTAIEAYRQALAIDPGKADTHPSSPLRGPSPPVGRRGRSPQSVHQSREVMT